MNNPNVLSELLQLHAKVECVRRQDILLLVAADSGVAVRVSPGAESLIPKLEEGVRYGQLVHVLKELHPGVADVRPSLNDFLRQLQRSNLLAGSQQQAPVKHSARRFPLFSPDRAAKATAAILQWSPAWLSWGLLAVLLFAASVASLVLPWQFALVPLQDFVGAVNLTAVLLFWLLVVPLHEAGHAIACRLAGCKVGEAGIILHGGILPGPYIQTNQAYRLKKRSPRFWIAAAGPLVNLLAAGAAAGLLLLVPSLSSAATDTLGYLFVLCVMFVYFDTSPLTASDGSHMLEAALDDELARRSALSGKISELSNPTNIRVYRICILLHLLLGVALVLCWWL